VPRDEGLIQWVQENIGGIDVPDFGAEPGPAPAADLWAAARPEPARGAHAPNQMYFGREIAGGQIVVMRTDDYGWEYDWLYLYKEEAAKLAKLLMERLAKEALGARAPE